jgi:CHAT domain
VWLGERATERNLKALSREGKLARYKVLHFATHGLLAGESEAILKAKAEPALILTPPDDGKTAAELEEDDGLLTASEVAQLELDADWIVLSACNTAAGDKGDAEALSGPARAFFYTKARALLVSHWYVNSDAAVKLTTRAFAELSANPQIGRAEALRRSMAELITKGAPHEAHPANWAPFVLVVKGRARASGADRPSPEQCCVSAGPTGLAAYHRHEPVVHLDADLCGQTGSTCPFGGSFPRLRSGFERSLRRRRARATGDDLQGSVAAAGHSARRREGSNPVREARVGGHIAAVAADLNDAPCGRWVRFAGKP